MSLMGPDRVKTRTPGWQFMNFSRFAAFRPSQARQSEKNSLQMRRFQTISEFSHSLDPDRPLALSDNNGRSWATKQKSIKPHQLQASALDLSDVRSRITAMRERFKRRLQLA